MRKCGNDDCYKSLCKDCFYLCEGNCGAKLCKACYKENILCEKCQEKAQNNVEPLFKHHNFHAVNFASITTSAFIESLRHHIKLNDIDMIEVQSKILKFTTEMENFVDASISGKGK